MNSLDAFFLPLFVCKLPLFRLQSPTRDVTQELWGCTASYLPRGLRHQVEVSPPDSSNSEGELDVFEDAMFLVRMLKNK